MKKNFTILSAVLITLFSLNAKAQDEVTQAKSYLGLTGGFSTPASNFGQSNYSNNNAGFAKKGTMLGLDAGIYLYKNFGIGITFSYQDQGELTGADAQNLANGYLASFGKDESNVTAVNRYQNLNLKTRLMSVSRLSHPYLPCYSRWKRYNCPQHWLLLNFD